MEDVLELNRPGDIENELMEESLKKTIVYSLS